MSNVLVVYFSRTGTTKTAALRLARELGADVEQIREHRSREGLFGWMRSAYEATFGIVPSICPIVRDPAHYDLVVLATPTWNALPSSPILAFVRAHRDSLKRVAFFCTYDGRGSDRVFTRLSQETGKHPVAVLGIPRPQQEHGITMPKIISFAQQLTRASSRPGPMNGPTSVPPLVSVPAH